LPDTLTSTEDVMAFLRALAASNRPRAQADLDNLVMAKRRHVGGRPFGPWDRDFYAERVHISHHAPLSPYFSVGTVVEGLSRLFSSLYGVSFELEEVGADEQVWHPSVRKLAVVDEREGRIGTIYCDLFAREGKPPSAAHYTVRCSRRVDDDDATLDGADAESFSLESAGVGVRGRPGRYQLPVVVLTCDFDEPESRRPGLLEWHEVATLFHEVGHAMHSMLGQASDYHNLAGTRCATDFVELPSVLMEHFAADERVMGLFARHYRTDEPLPLPLFRTVRDGRERFAALETNAQISMAALDQAYHTPAVLDPNFDSTATYAAVQREFSVIPSAPNVAWQTRFTHLVGYVRRRQI